MTHQERHSKQQSGVSVTAPPTGGAACLRIPWPQTQHPARWLPNCGLAQLLRPMLAAPGPSTMKMRYVQLGLNLAPSMLCPGHEHPTQHGGASHQCRSSGTSVLTDYIPTAPSGSSMPCTSTSVCAPENVCYSVRQSPRLGHRRCQHDATRMTAP